MMNSEITSRIRITARINAVIAENLIRTTHATTTVQHDIPSYTAPELLLRASRYLAHALNNHQNDFPFAESLNHAIAAMKDAKERAVNDATRKGIASYILVLEEILPHL